MEPYPWIEPVVALSDSGCRKVGSAPTKNIIYIINVCKQSINVKILIIYFVRSIYLVGFHEGFASHVKLRLGERGGVSTVAIEEWVCAVSPHGGGIPVLNHPRARPNPTPY